MKPFAALLMSLIIAATACQTSTVTHGVPNLAQVNGSVWRGGQPTAEGWAYLRSLGVTNVVKLNPESEGVDSQAGVTVFYFPISFEQQMMGGPSKETVKAAVGHIAPFTYVHCSHGFDRTGVVIAVYRTQTGMTKGEAEKEMLAHGFHKELFGLWSFWENYQPEK